MFADTETIDPLKCESANLFDFRIRRNVCCMCAVCVCLCCFFFCIVSNQTKIIRMQPKNGNYSASDVYLSELRICISIRRCNMKNTLDRFVIHFFFHINSDSTGTLSDGK